MTEISIKKHVGSSLVKVLDENGAKVDAQTHKGIIGDTALTHAAKSGQYYYYLCYYLY